MKFYDFSDYEYYALIGVSERETFPLDVALEAYMEEVADFEEEKMEQFEKEIDLNNKLSIRYYDNRYVLLLIDGSLI